VLNRRSLASPTSTASRELKTMGKCPEILLRIGESPNRTSQVSLSRLNHALLQKIKDKDIFEILTMRLDNASPYLCFEMTVVVIAVKDVLYQGQ